MIQEFYSLDQGLFRKAWDLKLLEFFYVRNDYCGNRLRLGSFLQNGLAIDKRNTFFKK